jgi:LuxR family glucitol operon transcriptional activator
MVLLQFDPTNYLPESLKKEIFDTIIASIASLTQKVLGEEASSAIKRLQSDRDFQKAVDEGLKEASKQFSREYMNIDEDLAEAIGKDPDFWKAETVRSAILEIIKHPGADISNERQIIEAQFNDVLGQRKNRERVNRAVIFYLRKVVECLWCIPQIKPIYELQMQRLSLEKLTQMTMQIEGLRADVKQVMIELIEAVSDNTKLLPETVLVEHKKSGLKVFHNLQNPDYGKFFDRNSEEAQIISLLRPYPDSQYHVIVIDGVGGVGKSALALRISHHYLDEYDALPLRERFDAIIWTSAKSTILGANGIIQRQQVTRNIEDIFATISITLGREDITRSSLEEQWELVNRALVQQRTLLVIDNLETLDDERVISFLRELPAPTKAIVTTRHRKIDFAYPVRLVGMPFSDVKALIIDICMGKDFELNEKEQERLYNLTGGVPLAITWSISQMYYRGNKELILKQLANHASESEISRFCFDGTIKLIETKDAFRLLKALSIIAGDTSKDILSVIAGYNENIDIFDESLGTLERLSLVNRANGRYGLLPLTRQYALAKLEDDPNFRSELLKNSFQYYWGKLSERERSDFTNHYWFDLEKNNILYLLDLFHSSGNDEYVAHLMQNFDVYLWVRGLWNESLKHLKISLAFAERTGDISLQAHSNRALGRIYLYRGKYELACMHLENAYRLYKRANNYRQVVSSATYLSLIFAQQGKLAEAEKLLLDNQETAILSEENETVIRLQNALAEIEIEQDRLDDAKKRIEEVLDMDKKKDIPASTLGIGTTFFIAGKLSLHKREFEMARYYLDRSLNIAINRGVEQDRGYTLLWLGSLSHAEGKTDEAKTTAEEALKIFKQIGDVRGADQAEGLLQELSDSWKKPMLKQFTGIDKYY